MHEIGTHIPVTGRTLEQILRYHPLPLSLFENATVYDLGCGSSDVGAELALRGIYAAVTGFDTSQEALKTPRLSEHSTVRRCARLDALPAKDVSADVVLATYSLPYWARTPQEVMRFFGEAERVTRYGGFLSIFPVAVRNGRFDTAQEEALRLKRSGRWRIFSAHPELLLAQKIEDTTR